MKKFFLCLPFVIFGASVAVYAGPPAGSEDGTTETEFTRDGLTYSVQSVSAGKGEIEYIAVVTGRVNTKDQYRNGPLIIAIPDTVQGSTYFGAPIYGYKKYAVKTIGKNAFQNIDFKRGSEITFFELIIPRTVTRIDDEALQCTFREAEVTGSSGSSVYYSYTTKDYVCSFITIPENVEYIGKNIFSPYISYSVTWLAKNCTTCNTTLQGAKSITFGTMVESIPAKLCAGSTKLSQVILPHSVTTIGEQAFAGCTSLSSLAIGAGCTTIGSLAFAGCTDLSRIVCYADVPPMVAPYAFIDVPIDADIEVPCGQVSLYTSAPEWKYFWAFDEIIPFNAVAQSSNEEWGTACVDFNCAEATFTAAANEGFRFKQWSNGRIENPLTMPLSENIELVAEFEDMLTGMEEVTESAAPFVVESRSIVLPNALPLTIYDVAGHMVYMGNRQHIELPAAGLYLVQAGENRYKINIQ